ncbi:Hypothetical_protein [Hexamita inflata]|uniref:Hypothetical_protein n=1 Tax=Hexamita inflata TaxID=28002 RepID=A0AA86R865_9EUKA|nr:Hypothetical protein HINF_LOCUS55733 [Hexamita inflata]
MSLINLSSRQCIAQRLCDYSEWSGDNNLSIEGRSIEQLLFNTTQPCLQGSSLFAYKGVTIFISLISKNVSKMYLVEMSNLKDLWLKKQGKNYGICHLLIREFCTKELPYK